MRVDTIHLFCLQCGAETFALVVCMHFYVRKNDDMLCAAQYLRVVKLSMLPQGWGNIDMKLYLDFIEYPCDDSDSKNAQ